MIKVNRIVYAVFETPELEAQVDYYSRVLGLNLVQRDGDMAFLSTSGDHHCVVLRKAAVARCLALGFQLPRGTDMKDYQKQIEAHGIATELRSDAQPDTKETLVFVDAKGTQVEIFAEAEPSGVGFQRQGVVPNKLGHIAFNVTDVNAAVKFYREVLGFRVSDWMGEFFAFLRCGPDHHSINLVQSEAVKMHHIAFELTDWSHVRDSMDVLAMDRIAQIWGPVRHGIGHNIATYHKNVDNQIVEFYCEMDQVNDDLDVFEPRRFHQSFPQSPKVWTDIPFGENMWGISAPQEFLD